MFSRRQLMKHFGAGALIAPIIGGKPDESVAAQLIEVPRVRQVELHREMPKPLQLSSVVRGTVRLELEDGTVRTLDLGSIYGGGSIAPDCEVSISAELFRVVGDCSPSSEESTGRLYGRGRLL